MGCISNTNSKEKPFPPEIDYELDNRLPGEALPALLNAYQQAGDFVVMRLRESSQPTYLLSHPRLIEQVLATNHNNVIRGFSADRIALLLGNGLLVSEGEVWKTQRQILHPMFHNHALLRPGRVVERSAARLVDRWKVFAQTGQEIDLNREMLSYSLEINLRSLFGVDAEPLLAEEQNDFFAQLTEEPRGDARENLQFLKSIRSLQQWLADLIDRRRKSTKLDREHSDLLDDLIHARSKKSGALMSDKQISDEVLNLLTAGHVTLASALSHSCLLLAKTSAASEEVNAEVENICQHSAPDYEHVQQFVVTRRVAQECLRICPPIWILTRRATQSFKLDDVTIPMGAELVISPYIVHRHEEFWPDPERFDAGRFTAERIKARPRHAYLPFSAGPRSCIGDQLSLMELTFTLASIFQELRLNIARAPDSYEAGFVYRSKQPVYATIEKR